ncbi:hypothetical protein DFJ75_4102 [Williamsia muralis]|uniref:Uncharacterized protein n=1 Tax=Williamsia marianensis TaxID=85044 RepID=A0A495K9K3_WILMA|nr:hypothetical protein [Williamsia muralis]RKR97234.1 hypothetical protein DFJ75_4102 [Williamsia muralis]
MTNDPGDAFGSRPDLTKADRRTGDGAQPTQHFAEPADPQHPGHVDQSGFNPYPPAQPSDQFVPYPPPYQPSAQQFSQPAQYGNTQYGNPQYGVPQYGVPQFGGSTPGFDPKPVAVGLTRAFGAAALVGALLMVAYGWLTWASFEPKTSNGPRASVNGWGQVFEAGEPVDLGSGASGAPYAGVFLPLFVLPVAILGLLVLCNIGRFGNSIAVFVLSVLHLLLAIIFLAAPSICILFESDFESEVFEATNDFTTGPGAVLATLTLLVVTGTSLAGIVLGRKRAPVQAPTYGYQPY